MKAFFSILIVIGFISCLQTEPPKTVTVEAPVPGTVNSAIPDSIPVLLFVVKGEKIFYSFDSAKSEKNLSEIVPATSAEIVKTITAAEAKHTTTLNEENIILKGDSSLAGTEGFKKIKEALKEKQYLKFRIVTTAE